MKGQAVSNERAAAIRLEKEALKDLKQRLKTTEFGNISPDHTFELIDSINMIIGRLNCELTDDDNMLEELAIRDKVREA